MLMGKVVLITGAGSGIGRATAVLFARQGGRALADINEPGGLETVSISRDDSGDADFVPTDVGKMEDVEKMVDTCFTRFRRLDIIHSNAAAHIAGSAHKIGKDDWDRTQAVCLKATSRRSRRNNRTGQSGAGKCFRFAVRDGSARMTSSTNLIATMARSA
jgi:NAD(P)-dependent dehydrogenase (short-subunit alcohol dehydrogenase family)